MTVLKLAKYRVPCSSISISPDANVLEFLHLMANEKTDAALVIGKTKDSLGNEIETLVGLVTDTDYRLKGEIMGRTAKDTPVEVIMTPEKDIVFVRGNAALSECLSLMEDNVFNHLVWVEIVIVEYEKINEEGEEVVEAVQEERLSLITYREVAWTLVQDEAQRRFEHFGMMEHQQ